MPNDMGFFENQTFGDVLREMDLEHFAFPAFGL